MSHKHSNDNSGLLIAGVAAIAAAVGATVAMLFTPRDGAHLRSGLRRRAVHMKDDVQNKFAPVVDEATDAKVVAQDKAKTAATKATRATKSTAAKAKTRAKAATKPTNSSH